MKGKPSVLGAASGMVAGLAAITPASGFVTVPSALLIGLSAGVVCFLAVTRLKQALGYDDTLDVFGVHGVGSALGMLLCGLLADPAVNPAIAATYKVDGAVVSLAGGLRQLQYQLVGVLFTTAVAGLGTLVILRVVRLVVGAIRVNEDEEHQGLDVSQHGETAYNEDSQLLPA